VSRGHSCRKGRSRCTSKIGPHVRAHKKRSVVRQEAGRVANGGRSQSDPIALMVEDARPDSRRAS
jgi:hypothetical protein